MKIIEDMIRLQNMKNVSIIDEILIMETMKKHGKELNIF